jgi:hypothetical protein
MQVGMNCGVGTTITDTWLMSRRPRGGVDVNRHGLKVEAEAFEAGVCGKNDWGAAGGAPSLSAVPRLEVFQPEANIGSEAGTDAYWGGAFLARVNRIEHTPHEWTCTRQDLGCKRELAEDRLNMLTTDDGTRQERGEKYGELRDSLRCTRQCLLDGVDLYTEKRERLSGAFSFVLVHYETELPEGSLSCSESKLKCSPRGGDEEEII